MRSWRGVGAALLLLVAAPPLLMPLLDLVRLPSAWRAWNDLDRLRDIAGISLLLTLAVVLLVLPLGTVLAILLFRCDLPGRSLLRALLLLGLFVPLPLLVAGWEACLAALGWTRQPGLLAAVLLHAAYALPWVVFLIGLGLTRVERSSEEDALTVLPAHQVLLRVTLRRIGPALLAALVWVVVQTNSEIVITNLYQVRTFAEEVYTQFVRLDPDLGSGDVDLLAARALVVSLPSLIVTGTLLFLAGRALRNGVAITATPRPALIFATGRWRGLLTALAALVVLGLLILPLVGLLRQAGLSGEPPSWSWRTLGVQLSDSFRSARGSMLVSFLVAAWVGVQTTFLALVLCWLARESRRFFLLAAATCFLALMIPGPVVGMGMKTTILKLVEWPDWDWLNRALYDGPSFAPVVWVQTIRLLPFALALLWPAMMLMPRSLLELARLDGAAPSQELFRLIVPLMRPALIRAALLMTALALGEIAASKLVSTPGAATFAEQLFQRMHYTSEGDLAARALLFLTPLAALALLHASLTRHS